VAVRIEGELGPVIDVTLGGRENVYFEHHVLLWKEPQVSIGLKPLKAGEPAQCVLGYLHAIRRGMDCLFLLAPDLIVSAFLLFLPRGTQYHLDT
jgi:hypothetical protein